MEQAMTPEEIKEQKPYLDWSLTEKEYNYIADQLLGRLPNFTETGLFSAMWSEHCSYKKSKPVLRLFPNKNARVLQGPGKVLGLWTLMMVKQWYLKLKATTTQQLLNHTKVPQPVLVESSGTFSVWVRVPLLRWTHYILVN
jgi:phosphoribosylformylglycinamidine (FGAM) synthase-like enzyme